MEQSTIRSESSNLSPGEAVTAAEPRARLVAWWGETLATLEAISDTANDVARHASREESPLYRCIDPEALYHFAGELGDLTTNLYNNEPVPIHDPIDPTEDLPALPSRREVVASRTPDPSADAAETLNRDTAQRVERLTDEERRTLIAKSVPSLAIAAATSDLLPPMFGLMVEFIRRYYPDADHATLLVSFADHKRTTVHLPVSLAEKGGAA